MYVRTSDGEGPRPEIAMSAMPLVKFPVDVWTPIPERAPFIRGGFRSDPGGTGNVLRPASAGVKGAAVATPGEPLTGPACGRDDAGAEGAAVGEVTSPLGRDVGGDVGATALGLGDGLAALDVTLTETSAITDRLTRPAPRSAFRGERRALAAEVWLRFRSGKDMRARPIG